MAIVNNYLAGLDPSVGTRILFLNGLNPDLALQSRVPVDADRTIPSREGQIFPQNTPLFDV